MPIKIFKLFFTTLTIILIAITLFIFIFGWNWARAPLQHLVSEKTGRELIIKGDLDVKSGWPAPHIYAKNVTFSNPSWAKQPEMFNAEEVIFTIKLISLLKLKLEFPEVKLTKPTVFLELAPDGKKSWLLDMQQSDDNARIPIGSLTLDKGVIGYDDTKQSTSIRAQLSSKGLPNQNDTSKNIKLDLNDIKLSGDTQSGVTFKANGFYKGVALKAQGAGGSVLSLNDQNTAYPIKFDATLGKTNVKGDGSITSLLKLTAMDMQLAIKGDNLAALFQLLELTFPESHAYSVSGHVKHYAKLWQFNKFNGVIGKSDIAGSIAFDNSGSRPMMRSKLVSKVLDLNDLGPLIGAKKIEVKPTDNTAKVVATSVTPDDHRVLPNVPFKTDRWNSLDADVSLKANSILRDKALPLDNLVVHLTMQNSVLKLSPLDFGFAGGHLKSTITLNGQQNPMQATAKINVRKVVLSKLFPTIDLTENSVGQINGDFDLSGQGNSIDRMLGTANGRVSLVVEKGKLSKLLIEKIGLHLDEILQLKIAGDKIINLNCAVADFHVKHGVMQTNALLLDTEVSTIFGNGTVNLNQEKLDLTLNPKTKNTSFVALSTPIYVTGNFANPAINVNKGKIAARGLGAVALSILNPLLVIIPLLDLGPGVESECGRLIKEAQAPPIKNSVKNSVAGKTP